MSEQLSSYLSPWPFRFDAYFFPIRRLFGEDLVATLDTAINKYDGR